MRELTARTCGGCGDGGRRGDLDDGLVEVGLRVGGPDRAPDAQHLAEGLLVSVGHLELAPGLPEIGRCPRVRQAARVDVDCARTVDLLRLELERRVPEGGEEGLVRLGGWMRGRLGVK